MFAARCERRNGAVFIHTYGCSQFLTSSSRVVSFTLADRTSSGVDYCCYIVVVAVVNFVVVI